MRRPFARFLFSLAAVALATTARAVSRQEIELLFRPFLAERLTLSPDGQHIAYSEHKGDELDIVIMKLAPPYAKITLAVADDQELTFSQEKERATLRFLEWGSATRLVFAPAVRSIRSLAPGGPIVVAPIMAVDADGQNPTTLVDAKALGIIADPGPPPDPTSGAPLALLAVKFRVPFIKGFAAGDREHLLVQALGDSGNPTDLLRVDIHSGKSAVVSSEAAIGDYVYDRQAHARLSFFKGPNRLDQVFQYRSVGGAKRWSPLEDFLAEVDAQQLRVTVENYLGERAIPLGFDTDPDVLYVSSNVGRDTLGVRAFNVKTKQRLDFAVELPHVDLAPLTPDYPGPQLVFDESSGSLVGVRSPGPKPATAWRDPAVLSTQQALEKKFPKRTVDILEWTTDRSAFLVRVTGGTEPGRTFVYQKTENLMLEIMRRAPWLAAAELHATEFFEFDTAAGVHLTGYVTVPRKSRLNPPPAVIVFADGFPANPHSEFDREAQVLAAMGLTVIRLNHRGVGGFGLKHRDAILAGIDRVPVDDAVATLDWIAARHPIDRKRVATMGGGFGGYLAVRATQLRPEIFRCAVTSNATLNPATWVRPPVDLDLSPVGSFMQEVNRAFLKRSESDPTKLSALAPPATLTHPVFQIVTAGRADAIEIANRQLRSQLKKIGDASDYVEVTEDYAAELPAARLRVYERLEEFLNLALYDYKVKVGPTKEIK